ncbi:hypothetical protein C0Z17_11540 [Trinickia caryophylli]|nr:hypothetical protein C0Z17_11540 [Trinickia caryophylli]
MSPDIIPYGQDFLDYGTAVETYGGPDIGKAVINNLNNFIYVRCKNIADTTIQGTVNLYYANASLFLLPSTWTRVSNPNPEEPFVFGDGSTYIPGQAIALAQSPFSLGGLPGDGHYCFIAVANNNNIPFGVPSTFDSNADFALWVRNNPNVAQRNVEHRLGSDSTRVEYLTFGNSNPFPSNFLMVLQGAGLPPKVNWEAKCADTRLSKPFSDGGTFSTNEGAATTITVPPLVGSGTPLMTMAFTFSTHDGQPFPPTASITVNYFQLPTSQEQSATIAEKEKSVVREYSVPAMEPGGPERVTSTLMKLGSAELLFE